MSNHQSLLRHEQHGVVFHLGGKASGLTRGGGMLEGGERLDADFIVAGIGVRPATALADQAGLRVEKGIVVDAYLETATKGVFAVGAAARWPNARGGGLVRIEHWVLAQRQGQAVARTIVGERMPFTDVPFFWSQHYDISINYVGMPSGGRSSRSTGASGSTTGAYVIGRAAGSLRWRASFATGRASRPSWRWSRRPGRDADVLQRHRATHVSRLYGALRVDRREAASVQQRQDIPSHEVNPRLPAIRRRLGPRRIRPRQ